MHRGPVSLEHWRHQRQLVFKLPKWQNLFGGRLNLYQRATATGPGISNSSSSSWLRRFGISWLRRFGISNSSSSSWLRHYSLAQHLYHCLLGAFALIKRPSDSQSNGDL